MKTTLKLLDELEAKASPRPWRKNSVGTTVDAKGEPVSLVYIRNEAFGIVAVNHLRALVEAVRDGHFHTAGHSASVRRRIELTCLRCQALSALHQDLEAALKEVGSG